MILPLTSAHSPAGTWSLLGVKTHKPMTDFASRLANDSNEGGVGYNRYQKNIMGMWLVDRLRDELCQRMPFSKITSMAEESRFDGTVDANAPAFLAPVSMKTAFDAALRREGERGLSGLSLLDSMRLLW